MSCRRPIRVPYSPPALGPRRQIIGLTEPNTPGGDVAARLGTAASQVTPHGQLIGHSYLAASAAPHILMLPLKSKRTLLAVDAIQVPLVLRSELAERRLSRRGQ